MALPRQTPKPVQSKAHKAIVELVVPAPPTNKINLSLPLAMLRTTNLAPMKPAARPESIHRLAVEKS